MLNVLIFYSLNLHGINNRYLPMYDGVRVHVTKIDFGAEGVDFAVTEAVDGDIQTKAWKTSSFLKEKIAINWTGYTPLNNEEEGALKAAAGYALSMGRLYGDFNYKSLYLVVVDGVASKGLGYSDKIGVVVSMKQLADLMVEIGSWVRKSYLCKR